MSDSLAALPRGTFPLDLAPGAKAALTSSLPSKRASGDTVLALRYGFKPASVTAQTPGALEPEGSGRVLAFDLESGGSQVFDVREESSKPRECALVWDAGKQAFTLHTLPSTLHLTLNRTLSARRTEEGPRDAASGDEGNGKDDSEYGVASGRKRRMTPPPAEEPPVNKRRSVSGKGIARKQLPAGVASATAAPVRKTKKEPASKTGAGTRGKAAAAKATTAKATKAATAKTTKAKTPAKGKKGAAAGGGGTPAKVKSVAIIDDSDEDGDGEDYDEGMDEFANMLGEAVGGGGGDGEDGMDEFADMLGAAVASAEEDDDDDVEEDDDDDELGGAQYASGYHHTSAAQEEGVEWI